MYNIDINRIPGRMNLKEVNEEDAVFEGAKIKLKPCHREHHETRKGRGQRDIRAAFNDCQEDREDSEGADGALQPGTDHPAVMEGESEPLRQAQDRQGLEVVSVGCDLQRKLRQLPWQPI